MQTIRSLHLQSRMGEGNIPHCPGRKQHANERFEYSRPSIPFILAGSFILALVEGKHNTRYKKKLGSVHGRGLMEPKERNFHFRCTRRSALEENSPTDMFALEWHTICLPIRELP